MQKETENKYTFIADYKQGIYISQCKALDIFKAIDIWVNEFSKDFLNDSSYNKLKKEYNNEVHFPIEIDNISNVWCSSYTINRNLILLNIIQTV